MNLKTIPAKVFIILNNREKRYLWKLAVADVIVSLLDIAFLAGLFFVIAFYTQGRSMQTAAIFSLFGNDGLLPIVSFFFLYTLKNLLGVFVARKQYYFVYDVASRISKDNLVQYLFGPYENFVHLDSSVVNRKVRQQPIEFCHYVLNGLQQLFSQFVLILITIIAIALYDPWLVLLLAAILIPCMWILSIFMKRKLEAGRRHEKGAGEKVIQYLQEALNAFVESNVYLKNDFFVDRYHRSQQQLNHYLAQRLVIQHIPSRLMEVFAVFGLLALIVIHRFFAAGSAIALETIGALMIAAYKIIPGVVKMTNITSQLKSYAFTTVDLAPPASGSHKRTPTQEHIRSVKFEGVCFDYPAKKILSNVSFKAETGDVLGITGMSGYGKTTLINLLLGFIAPQGGSISINGKMSDAEARKSFWNRVAYVRQDAFFVHGPAVENITLEEAGHDHQKLESVVHITGLDTILPAGAHTLIAESGRNLSGGQRQRLALARALYKEFDLLVLDEPFNELDPCAEHEMLEQLKKIAAQHKIVFLITHNAAALSYCNKKISLNGEG